MHNPRLDQLTDYPFQRLAALLEGLAAGQSSPCNLSIGEPQHGVPAMVAPLLAQDPSGWGRYPPTAGTPQWRAAAWGWLNRRYHLPEGMIDRDTGVVPVSGTREALYLAGQLLIPPAGDGQNNHPIALMPNPFYQVYFGSAIMNGAEAALMNTDASTGFLPNLSALSPDVLDRAAVITICSPANPQGAVASLEYWTKAIELARRHDFVLIADECYSEIWRTRPAIGVLEACHALGGSLDHVLVFNSLSKRSSVPGLRSGLVTGDRDLVARFLRLRAYAAPGMALPISHASAALWADEAHVDDNRRLYQAKMDMADRLLSPVLPGFQAPEGGFFLWLPVPAGFANGEDLTCRLWVDTGIRVLPGAYLTQPDASGNNPGDGFVRVALVHDLATTERALSAMADVLSHP